ncbi:MAG TPA: hypothetical protein VFJ74_15860 [Gemmatimonadaceae bacterium]|nr:hypothetical protein [Gemmatimonadaceae bacterium]
MPRVSPRPAAAAVAVVAATFAALALGAASLGAQDSASIGGVAAPAPRVVVTPKTVVAVNVAGLALGVTSLEGERALGRAVGLGAGVTHWSLFSAKALAYTSADLRLRWYVTGSAPAGLAVAAVGGATRVSSALAGRSMDAVGAGFEVSWSELALPSKRLYLAVGAGTKWLKPRGTPFDGITLSYPTARAAIGWGF